MECTANEYPHWITVEDCDSPQCLGPRAHLPMQETWETRVRSLGWEDHLEGDMATPLRVLTWKIPWMEEPGRLQSVKSQRVGYDGAT